MAFNISNFGAVTTRWGNPANYYPTYWIYNSEADGLATVNAAGYFNSALSVYDVNSGDKVAISTSSATSPLSFSGTFRNDGAGNLFIDWDRTYFLSTIMQDISTTDNTAYFGLVPAGVIVETAGVQWAAITVQSSAITFQINGTGITGAGFNVSTSGVAGTLYTAVPTAANVVAAGNVVSVTTNGASSTAASMTATIKIICAAQV